MQKILLKWVKNIFLLNRMNSNKNPSNIKISPSIITISRETKHRLINDIKDIIVNPLTNDGIYYIHDEENMLQGYALIIGPSDTISADGFYLLE